MFAGEKSKLVKEQGPFLLVLLLASLASWSGILSLFAPAAIWFSYNKFGKMYASISWVTLVVLSLVMFPWSQFQGATEVERNLTVVVLGVTVLMLAFHGWLLFSPFKNSDKGLRMLTTQIWSVVLGSLFIGISGAQVKLALKAIFEELTKAIDPSLNILSDYMALIAAGTLSISILTIVGFTYALGLRLSQKPGSTDFRDLVLPTWAIWGFIIGIISLLAVWKLGLSWEVSVILLTMALGFTALYFLQGIGIVQFLLARRGSQMLQRSLVPIIVMTLLLVPVGNIVVFVVLSLLGAAETWIGFRNQSQDLEKKEI